MSGFFTGLNISHSILKLVGAPVARPNRLDGKTEATLAKLTLLILFGSATG